MDNEFVIGAMEVGFTREQAEFMDEMVAKYPHNHSVEEIDGLDDYIDSATEDEEEEEEEDT